MKLMEDTVKINRCLEEDYFCSRNAVEICDMHKLYQTFQDIYAWYFSSVSIADLMEPGGYDAFISKVCDQLIEHIKKVFYSGKRLGRDKDETRLRNRAFWNI